MNALATPTKGIVDVNRLEREMRQGCIRLAKFLCPDMYIEEATIPVIQVACIYALFEQIRLRDFYIRKCLSELGIPEPPPSYEPSIENITFQEDEDDSRI